MNDSKDFCRLRQHQLLPSYRYQHRKYGHLYEHRYRMDLTHQYKHQAHDRHITLHLYTSLREDSILVLAHQNEVYNLVCFELSLDPLHNHLRFPKKI